MVHDFVVFWDEDHDTRIIPVLEEILMAGLIPGIQFIGEHKGELTIVLAAKTYWSIDDLKEYARTIGKLTAASGEIWSVHIGMIDVRPSSFRTGHQCDFKEIIGLPTHITHARLVTIDDMWKLGTKTWQPIGAASTQPGMSFNFSHDRYVVPASTRRGAPWARV